MKKSTKKTLFISIAVMISAFALILYVIELLTSEPVFDIRSFSLNYVISLPFILFSIIINCSVAAIMNRPALRKTSMSAKIAVEGISVVIIAVFLVIAGNLPFISDMKGFILSSSFLKSVAAATLINIFILVPVEFLIQAGINRNLQKENAVLRYRQLKSQINPHFLFNSLNALVSLINNDRDLAVQHTKKLSAVYRYVLTQDQQDTVTVRDEAGFIGNYSDILRTRFSQGLEFRFDIRPSDMDRAVPPMSLQLLVENAVKHNAVSSGQPLVIRISTDGEYLCVSNNINPRLSSSSGTGIGLENLSRKYAILAGRDITVMHDNNTFTVKLPLL